MNRREALASLTALAGATGMSVTPVTAKDAEHVVLIIIKHRGWMSDEGAAHIRRTWEQATKGTPLEGVKALIVDDALDVEFVRR